MKGIFVTLVLCVALLAQAGAQAPAATLKLDEVLDASSTHFPKILEALAKRRAAALESTVALGAFDLVFSAESDSWATGFYDGNLASAKATQALRALGADVYGQYRISTGDFPVYQDQNFTNQGGQAKIGVLFSLLRDRDIDERRFNERDAGFALRDADFNVLLTRIGVQQRAAVAYWKWVAAGQALGVYEQLLRIAQQRDEGLRKQVTQGAVARIFLTENERNITRRLSLVTGAQRDFAQAANALSFYYRNGDGEPQTVRASALPDTLKMVSAATVPALVDLARVDDALARRPEVRQLRNAIDRASNRMALRENALKPRFDVRMELAQGVGGVGEGGVSRDSTDATVGLSFSVPVQRREARAKLAQARNKLDALRLQRQQLEEKIELEVQDIVISLRYAEELATLADREVELSEALQIAEQRRFDSGASDFFLVNVREQAVANAKVRAVAARLATQVARANFDAATIDLTRLGLGADSALP
ncbi:MAG: TolC family protein [Gammaproteobacteria bacterium]